MNKLNVKTTQYFHFFIDQATYCNFLQFETRIREQNFVNFTKFIQYNILNSRYDMRIIMIYFFQSLVNTRPTHTYPSFAVIKLDDIKCVYHYNEKKLTASRPEDYHIIG